MRDFSSRSKHVVTASLVAFLLSLVFFQNCSDSSLGGMSAGSPSDSATGATHLLRNSTDVSVAMTAGFDLALTMDATVAARFKSPTIVLDAEHAVDGAGAPMGYSYGSSMILSDDGTGMAYHSYSCVGDYSGDGWDRIAYTRSSDRNQWSSPQTALRATRGSAELSACDPAVIRFNAGDGLFYYLYYGGGDGNVYVARSQMAAGPFLKFTSRAAWEQNAADPKIVIPHSANIATNMAPDGTQIWYGAGEPTVVVKGGQIYFWNSEDTMRAPNVKAMHVYLRVGTSPISFGAPTETSIPVADAVSVDIKYDATNDRFLLFGLENQISMNARLVIAASKDGMSWTNPQVYCEATTCLPNYASNVGASGDEQGHLVGKDVMVTFGAPYKLSGSTCGGCWAAWNMYGVVMNLGATTVAPALALSPPPAASASSGTSSSSGVYRMGSVYASEEVFPAANAIDRSPNGVWSSQPFASSTNDRGVQLAAWIAGGAQTVSKLYLKARMVNGQPTAFATKYTVYLTSPGNTQWDYIGEFSANPDANGQAIIQLGADRSTWGVLIVPRELHTDPNGNYYIQLDEVNLAR